MFRRTISLVSLASLLFLGVASTALAGPHRATTKAPNGYRVDKLVSDQAGKAAGRDKNLVNAWGLVAGPSTPWWVADNGTDVSTLYDGTGAKIPLVVKVSGAPTGAVFNGSADFVVSHSGASGPALFLFATEGGTIRGWSPGVPPPAPSTKAFTVVNRAGRGAIYKGLAIAWTPDGNGHLYATDFHNNRVDVFDGMFHQVMWKGAFKDPNLPRRFAPFGIQTIGNRLFVTFAKQSPDAVDEVDGAGLGFVDVFNLHGKLLGRVASRGPLDAPWGLAWAPWNFGRFSNDLLVGNFGDGVIDAYRWANGNWKLDGMLSKSNGKPVAIDGLWGISFGNGAAAGPTNSLYFTAGPDGESHGLFGNITSKG